MDDVRARLVRCFEAVFPNAKRSTLETATTNRMVEWDSLANVTLLSVIAEEFGVEIPLEQLEALNSFDALREFLQTAVGG